MRYIFNPIGDPFDLVDDIANNPIYITTTTYLYMNGNTLELWVNGTKVADWTVTPATPAAGSPLGLLLTLTYS